MVQAIGKLTDSGGYDAPSSIYNQYLNALLVPASSDFN